MTPGEEFSTAADFGRRFFEARNYAASLTWFEKAESIVRDQPAVLFNTALVLVKLQRYDDAQRRLDRYLLLYPQGPEIQQAKALQRELQFGIEVRRREQQDNEYKMLFSRARALSEKNLPREALEVFHQAEQLYSDDPALYYDEAVLNEEAGDLESALRLYKRYLQTNPANAAALQARLIDLEREISYMRTKLLCPFCGAILPVGARWCHRCWHGPYDLTAAAWNTRGCDAHVSANRSVQDASGKTRASEAVGCLYAGTTLRDLLQYSPSRRMAVREARSNDGWTFDKDTLESRRSAAGVELVLHQGDYLERVDNLATGETVRYRAHASADGIWLLDAQPFLAGEQPFVINRTFDGDGRVQREDVTYDSLGCHHAVTASAVYTYSGDVVTTAHFSGGYDGYRVEGLPQVRWEAVLNRTFDASGRLSREELTVTSFQKTWSAKPRGAVSDEVRRYYTALKVRKPTDIRALGDVCAVDAGNAVDEAIDLRPFFVIVPAVAVRLNRGDSRLVVDYAYSEK